MMPRLASLWRSLKTKLAGKEPAPTAIALETSNIGIVLRSQSGGAAVQERRVAWSEISRVAVFKRDLLTTDLLCLVLELPGPQTLELHEEMVGWQPLLECLHTHLPGMPPWHEWWGDLAFPAFETNARVLFERKAAAP